MSAFFDSNVLIYAFSTDARRERALAAIAGGGVISVQVLNEFTNVLRKKQKQEWPVIEAVLHSLRFRFPEIVPLTADTHAAALGLAREHGLALNDALIVAAATGAGCDTLYSEDMQHGRAIADLTIRNPFVERA
ncbi:PIN domain-containing protein [Bradyrhizobium sp. AZCC 1693]|uniref:PIN domain-containing protein n=1 Tax=Bradyrhizobium sp. AZCC 1693 TaxID=3117029 RepID=UPI002FF08A04